MPEPRQPVRQNRTNTVRLLLTDHELDMLEELAGEVSKADYIRKWIEATYNARKLTK